MCFNGRYFILHLNVSICSSTSASSWCDLIDIYSLLSACCFQFKAIFMACALYVRCYFKDHLYVLSQLILIKNRKQMLLFPVLKLLSPGYIKYSIMTIVNNAVLYTEIVIRVDF